MWPHKCWIEGNNHFLSVAGYFFNKPAQCEAGFYCCKDILLTHVQFLLQESRSLFAKPLLISWHSGYSKCRTQYLPLLSIMTSGMPLDTDARFTHTIHNCKYNYLFVTGIHQVYRHVLLAFCAQFYFFFFFLEKNNTVKFQNFIYTRGDFFGCILNSSNDKLLLWVGFCFVFPCSPWLFPFLDKGSENCTRYIGIISNTDLSGPQEIRLHCISRRHLRMIFKEKSSRYLSKGASFCCLYWRSDCWLASSRGTEIPLKTPSIAFQLYMRLRWQAYFTSKLPHGFWEVMCFQSPCSRYKTKLLWNRKCSWKNTSNWFREHQTLPANSVCTM